MELSSKIDPLRILAPFLIRAKYQCKKRGYMHEIEWDERFSPELPTKVTKRFTELSMLSGIRILRCLQELKTCTLHSWMSLRKPMVWQSILE